MAVTMMHVEAVTKKSTITQIAIRVQGFLGALARRTIVDLDPVVLRDVTFGLSGSFVLDP